MSRALTLGRPVDRRRLGIYALLLLLALPNFYAVAVTIGGMLAGSTEADWAQMAEASRRLDGGMYDRDDRWYNFQYSPLVAYLFVVLAPLGPVLWRIASAASLLLLPRRLALIAFLSWPFWWDLYAANIMTFAFVAAALGLRGNRWGSFAYLAIAALVPRPLYLPVAAWILWKQPDTRIPAAIGVVVMAVLILVSGWGPEWIEALVGAGRQMEQSATFAPSDFNFGPSAFVGSWWLLVGLPLAAWLTWKGRLGYASLAASPYWLPYYLLMVLLEVRERRAPTP